MRPVRWPMLVLVVAFVACGGDSGSSRPLAESSPTPLPRPLPAVARSSSEVDSVFHVGQEVFITDDGFKPKQLVAIVGEKISFTNETDETRTVAFDVLDFETKPIPSGKDAGYTPERAMAIAFHLKEDPDVRAQIQVEPYYQPGEDPADENRYDADTPGEKAPDSTGH